MSDDLLSTFIAASAGEARRFRGYAVWGEGENAVVRRVRDSGACRVYLNHYAPPKGRTPEDALRGEISFAPQEAALIVPWVWACVVAHREGRPLPPAPVPMDRTCTVGWHYQRTILAAFLQ